MTADGEFANSEFDDDERRTLFGVNASIYGDGRPGYPNELIDLLAQRFDLGPESSVLEVGPGAGQATADLLSTGASVTAVEPSAEFADLLGARFPDDRLDVITSDFEKAELNSGSFDVVAAATSFHWIEPSSGLGRVADLLAPNGKVALWWSHFGDSERPDPFRQALQPVLEKHLPQFTDRADGGVAIGAHPYALDRTRRTSEFAATQRFTPTNVDIFEWTCRQTAGEARDFFLSFSSWMVLDDKERTAALDAIVDLINTTFDGVVERPFQTALYTAQLVD